MITKRAPIGLTNREFKKFPSNTLSTERVDPHDGQGIPVMCLNRQIFEMPFKI